MLLVLLGFELAFCPGPRRDRGDGQLLFDAWLCLCQWTSGARIAAVGLGVGCRAREFDGLVWLEGWGRGRVGFQLSLQVEREFGD